MKDNSLRNDESHSEDDPNSRLRNKEVNQLKLHESKITLKKKRIWSNFNS